jgi:hypothetical protein
MGCNDPFIRYLSKYGYSVLRLPKAEVHPRQIFCKQGSDLIPLGELTTVLLPGGNVAAPTIEQNIASTTISGQMTGEMKLNLGLSILGGVIGAMGGSKVGLDTKYKDAKSVAFEFSDVLEDKIAIASLDQYLGDADVSPFSVHVGSLLESDEVYVTTSVLKSAKITVLGKRSDGSGLELDVPVIQNVIGGAVSVSSASEQASSVTYEGQQPLAFGFQAVRLYYDQGRYTAFKIASTDVAMRRIVDTKVDVLSFSSGFARLGPS